MKPFKEETTGLRTGINKLTFLFVILFTLSAECQVPLNGFCKLNSFPVDQGFTGLLSLNYNNDFYTDLVLYSPLKNKILVMEGNQSGAFLPYKELNINFQPSVIENIYDQNKKVTGYAYVSRKKRKAGILEFSPQGHPRVKKEIKLSSYPENISSSDIDQNGFSELLLSGKAFDGISLISFEKDKLQERKIVTGSVYASAVFTDITNDGLSDIIAYNLLTLGIEFYYNNGAGHFHKERTFSVNRKIRSLKVSDVNLDLYSDIICSFENSIDIYPGSFNSSYTLSKSIKVRYSPDIFISSDFNKDGRIDIAYTDTTKGILSIIFASGSNSFYDEINYLQKDKVSDIIPFYSKFINGLAVLTKAGYLYTVTNLMSVTEEVHIIPSIGASSPGYCHANNDAVNDLCFIDKFDNSIKLLINNSSGIPNTYYSFPLQQQANELLVLDDDRLTFITYCKGERLIQIITPDLLRGKSERRAFYIDGKITDLKRSDANEGQRIYATGFLNNELFLTSFDYTGRDIKNYKVKTWNTIIDAKILPGKLPLIYFWQSKGDSLILYHSSFNGYSLEKPVAAFTVNQKNFDNIISFVAGTRERNSTLLSVINAGRHRHVVVSGGRKSFMNSDNEITRKFDVTSENQFYYGEAYFKGFYKIMFYSPSERNLNWIEMLSRGRNLYFNKLVENVDATEYFIKNINLRNYNMVYINKENCLSVRQIQ